MSPDEARTVAKEAVRETMVSLGFDPDNPQEAQRDMVFLRSWRLSTEAVKRTTVVTAVTTIVIGILGLIWLVLKGGQP